MISLDANFPNIYGVDSVNHYKFSILLGLKHGQFNINKGGAANNDSKLISR